jgi:hypothetical protein
MSSSGGIVCISYAWVEDRGPFMADVVVTTLGAEIDPKRLAVVFLLIALGNLAGVLVIDVAALTGAFCPVLV